MNALPTFPWLTLITLLPLAGVLPCLLLRKSARDCRGVALATSVAVLGLTLWLGWEHYSSSGWYVIEDVAWIEHFGIRWTLGLDGLALTLIVLTALLSCGAHLLAWRITERVPFLLALLLIMESGFLGVFLALDLVLFYICWEVMLVPLFFLVGIWGREGRVRAALKTFLVTLCGSLLMLVGIVALYLLHGEQTGTYTFALRELLQHPLTGPAQYWVCGAFLAAFLIKAPIVPLHSWLIDAHTAAPVCGAVDLAGLLLKTGIYGLLRFGFPLFPDATRLWLPWLMIPALFGLFHAAWVAYRQTDLKRLAAYSSVSHLGLVVLGLAVWNTTALEGAILLMLIHGVSAAALFAAGGMIAARAGTTQLNELGGVWGRAPFLGGLFLLFGMASAGVPGLGNFVGEILILFGTFSAHPLLAAVAATTMVTTAVYMTGLLKAVLWGPPADDAVWADLTWREGWVLVPLALLIVWVGVYPEPFLAPLREPVQFLLTTVGTLSGGAP